MKNILIISLVTLLGITGCAENNRCVSSGESIECQRLRVLWERAGEENPQIIIPEIETEFGSESGDEMTWQELGEMVFLVSGCCFPVPHPLENEWIKYNQLGCILQYLEDESVRRIAFYGQVLEANTERPGKWYNLWIEVNEPDKITKTIKLLCEAIKSEKDKFANEDIVMSTAERMQIVTDKHKFIVPVSYYKGAVRGIGWTSYELQGRLKEWGFPEPKKSPTGRRKEPTEIDQSSLQEHIDALSSKFRLLQEQDIELIAQHGWLKRSLEKCIEKLEAERGLKPIPIEYSRPEWAKYPKSDPNVVKKYAPPSEPWFKPYERPDIKLPSGKPAGPILNTLQCLINLHLLSVKLYMATPADWIENFEKRLKRLESHLEK